MKYEEVLCYELNFKSRPQRSLIPISLMAKETRQKISDVRYIGKKEVVTQTVQERRVRRKCPATHSTEWYTLNGNINIFTLGGP